MATGDSYAGVKPLVYEDGHSTYCWSEGIPLLPQLWHAQG
jgi:hypothetical protein